MGCKLFWISKNLSRYRCSILKILPPKVQRSIHKHVWHNFISWDFVVLNKSSHLQFIFRIFGFSTFLSKESADFSKKVSWFSKFLENKSADSLDRKVENPKILKMIFKWQDLFKTTKSFGYVSELFMVTFLELSIYSDSHFWRLRTTCSPSMRSELKIFSWKGIFTL